MSGFSLIGVGSVVGTTGQFLEEGQLLACMQRLIFVSQAELWLLHRSVSKSCYVGGGPMLYKRTTMCK